MKFFSNLRFPSIDIDVVNNNELNRKQTPPFCCMFRAQTSLHLILMANKHRTRREALKDNFVFGVHESPPY